MSAVHNREAALLKMMDKPKKISREFDSRTTIDLEVFMIGKKINRHTIKPMPAEIAITINIEMRGLRPYSVYSQKVVYAPNMINSPCAILRSRMVP